MDKNLLLTDAPFAPAAPDSLEHLPSYHCAVDMSAKPPKSSSDGVKMAYRLRCMGLATCREAANLIDELAKKAVMYEHVRTLNPSEFTDIWVLNLRGGGSFDDLVLADMDKRNGDRA